GYLFLIGTSSSLVTSIITKSSGDSEEKKIDKQMLSIGFIIGRCENILIFSFMLLDAYTALALVFAAKALVRKEDIKKNSLYFLGGTLINVTYSVIIGMIIKFLIIVIAT
ncbi:hypothetical protein KKB18_04430, partial [bacterium]|nr:hypothetical protein [bacterium]